MNGSRATQLGLLVNIVLAVIKGLAGVLGHSYALIADAVESTADIFGSAVVWGSLQLAARDPDETYPFGYGKAEPMAAVVVALMILGAAVGIGIESVREIRTPHHAPAAWTLLVLAGVVLVKWIVARRLERVAHDARSRAVEADAGHHLSDAITSAAAFIGIAIAVLGGPGWESADDWAALVAAGVLVWNGWRLLHPALGDLMDRHPGDGILADVRRVAAAVPEVRAIEKTTVRRSGTRYFVDIHVQVDGTLSIARAHAIGGHVKAALRAEVPGVTGVLVHMEPHEG